MKEISGGNLEKHEMLTPSKSGNGVPRKPGNPNWLPGQSGNPHGRPIAARQKISEALLKDLAVVWEKEGPSILRRLAKKDPGTLAKIAYGLLPRDVFVTVDDRRPGNLDPEAYRDLLSLLDAIKSAKAAGSEPGAVFRGIEQDLRARLATPIEGSD